MMKKSIFRHKIGNFAKDFWQFFMLFWREFTKDEIDVSELLTKRLVASAEAIARKVVSAEVLDE